MAFWLVRGTRKTTPNGHSTSMTAADTPYTSFDEAAASLSALGAMKVSDSATETHAYVVEAATPREALQMATGVFDRGEMSSRVWLIGTDIPTEYVYDPIVDERSPEGGLERLYSEICITRQITDALKRVAPTENDRLLIATHERALEDFARTVLILSAAQRGERVTPETVNIDLQFGNRGTGGDDQTPLGVLNSLDGEMHILVFQHEAARKLLSPPEQEILDRHEPAVDTYRYDMHEMKKRWQGRSDH